MLDFRKRPTTIWPENATASSRRPNRARPASTSLGADSGRARLPTPATASMLAPAASSSATRSAGRIAEDEVEAGGGQPA